MDKLSRMPLAHFYFQTLAVSYPPHCFAQTRSRLTDVIMLEMSSCCYRKRWANRLVALEFSTSSLSSCSPSSSRTFYGVFSPVADLLIGNSVENLEWIEQTSKMKYEPRRFTMRGEISFFLSDELCRDEWLADGLQMRNMAACCWKNGVWKWRTLCVPTSSETRD